MNDENQTLRDEGAPDRYFHIMLNMADDELGPYEYRLLGHYRRVCGAHNRPCTESIRTTAAKVKFSVGKVFEVRRTLAAEGWIRVEEHDGDFQVTLVDRMPENVARYGSRSPDEQMRSPHEHPVHPMNAAFTPRTECSPDEHERSSHEHERSPGEPKKELIQELPKEPDQKPSSTTASADSTDSGQGVNPTPVVDDETSFIQDSIDSFGFPDGLAEVEQLRTMPACDALAYVLKARSKATSNPSGLLLKMLRMNQPPPPEMAEQATAALELRTLDLDQIDRHRRTKEYEQFTQAIDRHRNATTSGSAPASGDGAGLDERLTPDSAMTWRDAWLATMGQLQLQLNRSTFENWVRGARAVSYVDGKLTIRARTILAQEKLDQAYRPSIEQSLERLADHPVTVEFIAPESVRAGV